MLKPESKIVVLGGGSWGTALSHILACALEKNNAKPEKINIFVRDNDLAKHINEHHENIKYLPNLKLNPLIYASSNPEIMLGADYLVLATPCQTLRQTITMYDKYISNSATLINSAKGIELSSLKLPHQIISELKPNCKYATLSGPSFASEVLKCKPTAVVLASKDIELGSRLREMFSSSWFRTYSSTDLNGVELGGALKNVMAIAAGVCDGLELGDNARAALISRGLAEMQRLFTAYGAEPSTIFGLSGLGDLVLTCTGNSSRNRSVGIRLAKGEDIEQILSTLGSTAEGVKTVSALLSLAKKYKVEMPIAQGVHALIYDKVPAMKALQDLFDRELKDE